MTFFEMGSSIVIHKCKNLGFFFNANSWPIVYDVTDKAWPCFFGNGFF